MKQQVKDREGKFVDVANATVEMLKEVVENRIGYGGGTQSRRRIARRELKRRGYAWYVTYPDWANGPRVQLLHEDCDKEKEGVFSPPRVSPGAAWEWLERFDRDEKK